VIAAFMLVALGCQSAPGPRQATGALQGVVFDLSDSPVSGALIVIEGPGGKASATTDSQGRFSIPGLRAGEYTLAFSKAMYEGRSWPIVLSDFADAAYLKAASYWQLLEAALTALGEKELGEAEDFLARARAVQDRSPTSLFLEGVLAERRGDYAAAIGDLEAATALDARSAFLWLYLADLYERSDAGADKEAEALDKYLDLRDDPAAAERRKILGR